MKNQYLISPYIFSFKTIPIESATKEELLSCQRRSIFFILTLILGIFTSIQRINLKPNGFSFLLILGVAIYSLSIIAFVSVIVRVLSKIREIKNKSE